MSDTIELVDEEDYGVRWWDDFEVTGKTPAARAKQIAALEERLNRLYVYCADDVRAERAADKHLFPLSDSERKVYLLDQKINDRGVAVDLDTVKACINLLDKAAKKLDKEIAELTGGEVTALTQRDRLVGWLGKNGAVFPSLSKQAVAEALKTALPPKVKRALYLRQIGAKSSVKKLQAIMRMVNEEGRIQGNLLYHGASTGRFSGKGVQLQNLTRPELLKEPEDAIPYLLMEDDELIEMAFGAPQTIVADVMRSLFMAGKGKVLYAADFAQIEARVLAWIAGQDDLTEQFRNGDDIYSNFASKIFGRPINKKEHQTERQLGKTCIAEGTLVYTDRGLVEIQNVTEEMKVWDGVEWVNHRGAILQGTKLTLNVSGIWLTPDHRVLCGKDWHRAEDVENRKDIRLQALETGQEALLSLVLKSEDEAALNPFSSVATADQTKNIRHRPMAFGAVKPNSAQDAEKTLRQQLIDGRVDTMMCARMNSIKTDYCEESNSKFSVVKTQKTKDIYTMEVEELTYFQNGLKTGQNISHTSLHSLDGMTPSLKLTGSTLTVIMNREICDLQLDQRICGIDAKLATCRVSSNDSKKKSLVLKRVYDIANAGPRTRFMVRTPQGPLVVHNCILGLGFAMGAAKFVLSCEKSGIQIDEKESKRVVDIYRSTYSSIPKFWYNFEKAAIRAVKNPNSVITFRMFKMRMRGPHLRVLLPSGRALNYPFAKVVMNRTPWGEMRQAVEISAVNSLTRKWTRQIVTPGTWTENVVQAIARDVMVEGMFRLEEANYPVILSVHDEVISEADENYGDVTEYEALLQQAPLWAPDLPVKAEGWKNVRYRK